MTAPTLLQEWLALFQSVGEKPNGDGWYQARCPCPGHKNADSTPSLRVKFDARNRKVVLSCWLGHDGKDIAQAVGKTVAQMYEDNQERAEIDLGVTLADFAWSKGLNKTWLAGEWGLKDGTYSSHKAVIIPYYGLEKEILFRRYRVKLSGPNHMRQPKGVRLAAYGLWKLPEARQAGKCLILVEGESDTWTLWRHGFPAVGLPGDKSPDATLVAEVVEGFDTIYVWQENDAGGKTFINEAAKKLKELGFDGGKKLIHGGTAKDPSALYQREQGDFKEVFQQVLGAAVDLPEPAELPEEKLHETNGHVQEGRTRVMITAGEKEVNDAVIAALPKSTTIYQRGNMLATVVRPPPKKGAVLRPVGSPVVSCLPVARLREEITSVVEFRRPFGKTAAHPPDWCISAVHARGQWPGMRYLEAIVESPTLRPDGTVLDRAGYDAPTGLLYDPQMDFPAVPAKPGFADALEAGDRLLAVVGEFPFVDDPPGAHQAAWLAALLTPFARFAIAGPCPLFLMDASAPGTGKSLLCDVIATLATGRTMARTAFSGENEELRKVITAVVLAGDQVMLFDNVTGDFGGAALDAALTGLTWKDRILGRSEMTAELPLITIWFASGNNVTLRGDALRRVLPCRIESQQERPEERSGFKIPRLLEHVAANRGPLVVDCLTILRAYEVAGRPKQTLAEFGSFERWSDLVRAAVRWVRGVDPCLTRKNLRAADTATSELASLIHGWAELPEGETGCSAVEALKSVQENPGLYETLREVFTGWMSRGAGLPSAKTIGRRMAAYRGRVSGDLMLKGVSDRRGTLVWSAVKAK